MGVDFVIGFFVVGDVVDEDFVFFVVFGVFYEVVDVGFVFVVWGK